MNTTNKETIDSYNLAVNTYIEESPQFVTDELKVWIDGVLSRLNKDAKILEIGSGSGKDAAYFKSQGFIMELTDASKGFVEYLKNKNYDARVFNVLADEINSRYDLVFADAVFLHFTEDELRTVLMKVHTALYTTGQLAFTVKVGDGDESTTRKLGHARYFHYWQEDDITALLKQTGYSNIQIKSNDDFRGTDRPDWLYITADKSVAL